MYLFIHSHNFPEEANNRKIYENTSRYSSSLIRANFGITYEAQGPDSW